MTVGKGSDYGAAGRLPAGAPVVESDEELCRTVLELRAGSTPVVVGLIGGDLCRTLGGSGDRDRLSSDDAVTVPIDLAIATVDGTETAFVAHLLTGRPFGRDFAAVMNAQWWGELDLGPRSHPGDGLLDVTTGSLPWRQRRLAIGRARSGSHLPHPALRQRRTDEVTLTFDRPVPLLLDGVSHGTGSEIEIRLEPDAFSVVI